MQQRGKPPEVLSLEQQGYVHLFTLCEYGVSSSCKTPLMCGVFDCLTDMFGSGASILQSRLASHMFIHQYIVV
jgi:hypothetical protein